ncbi:MAG: DUF6506 family protein [Clostridiaceae bacterium]
MLKAAFMFLSPSANPDKHIAIIDTGDVSLIAVGVPNYGAACAKAAELLDDGIAALELCGGFGVEGTAMIKEALEGKIPVGVVRFDIHPGIGNASGDSVFM